MAASNSGLIWRNHALELELQVLRSKSEQREESWIRDYANLFELNQKQLDFTDEVLTHMSQKQREQEQVAQYVQALQMEFSRARQEQEQAVQHVQALQMELSRARQEREQAVQHVQALQLQMQAEEETRERKEKVETLVRFNRLHRERPSD